MAHDLTQADFDRLLPMGVDLRPMIADQTRKFLKSSDYKGSPDTDVAKAEAFLRFVERKGYARKIRKRTDVSAENSAPYNAMLKNWGRNHPKTKTPEPEGDQVFARGVFYYFFRDVPKRTYFIDIAKDIWPPHDLIFQRFYYAKYFDDPRNSVFSKVCSRFHADSHIIRREFDKIWLDTPVGPPKKVHLGPVTIVLGHEDDLAQLSLQEPANENYMTDGMPDVFKALDWRSRLSGLHGRERDAARLKEWARDETRKLSVMLVSGPGGVGKTRLVADVVAELVHYSGWCGGFLGDESRPINGNGAGVALIIDYPEERTSVVSEILKAVARSLKNGEIFDRPVRLILISRENVRAWYSILNESTNFIIGTSLDYRAYLEIADALAIVEDIRLEYSERLGRAACEFSGVEAWLTRKETHKLPLHIVAAAVHAVLDSGHAFKLDGPEILSALAEWELRRVRYYSKRDLGDVNSLERMIALSLFSQFGLTKNSILELGERGICFNKSGEALLDCVRRTPFWQPKTAQRPSHLTKLEPERAAAVFCLKALDLHDPHPRLPAWLVTTAGQDADGFGDRLSRLVFDIGIVNNTASLELEQQCILMLSLLPFLIYKFRSIAHRNITVFSSMFAIEICRRLIDVSQDAHEHSLLLNSMAIMLSEIGDRESALRASYKAVQIRKSLSNIDPENCLKELARSLTIYANDLSDSGKLEAALSHNHDAIIIYNGLPRLQRDALLPEIAASLNGMALRLIDLGRLPQALKAIRTTVAMYLHLASRHNDAFLPELGMSLNNRARILADNGKLKMAIRSIQRGVDIYRQLAITRPDAFLPKLAGLLNTHASMLSREGCPDAALKSMIEAVEIHTQFAGLRPDAFLPELAMSQNNLAGMYAGLEDLERALEYSEKSIADYRKISSRNRSSFLIGLSISLAHHASILLRKQEYNIAMPIARKAVDTLRPLFHRDPYTHKDRMRGFLDLYLDTCANNNSVPDTFMIQSIQKVLSHPGDNDNKAGSHM